MAKCETPLPRVLIVDDNPSNLLLAEFVLMSAGLTVEKADSALAVQAVVRQFLPDLILMDVQLPGMDGLTLTQLLKLDPSTSHIVVVALTADAMQGDAERASAAGCDGYLTKPVDVHRFANQVLGCWRAAQVRSG